MAKFGGSASGIDGEFVNDIVHRIKQLKQDSKVIAVFSRSEEHTSELQSH